jgi:hypothetical protein
MCYQASVLTVEYMSFSFSRLRESAENLKGDGVSEIFAVFEGVCDFEEFAWDYLQLAYNYSQLLESPFLYFYSDKGFEMKLDGIKSITDSLYGILNPVES